MDKDKVVAVLNELLEMELSGVVRYTHYSFMVFGHNRIPIVSWLRGQAKESLQHAEEIGEQITTLDAHPSLGIHKLLETHKHAINDILQESLEHEQNQVKGLEKLLGLVAGKNVLLEEFARKMIAEEETHISEVKKMLRRPE